MKPGQVIISIFILILTGCGGGGGDDGDNSNKQLFSVSKTSLIEGAENISRSPISGQGTVSVTATLQVTFNKELDGQLLNMKNIVLHNMNSHKQIRTKFEFENATRTLSVIPAVLEYNNHYMLEISENIYSSVGEVINKPEKMSFFTENKPALFLQKPKNGAIKVSTQAVAQVQFENNMNYATVNTGSFYMQDSSGNLIPGTVDIKGDSAVFKPNAELSINSQYFVVLSNTIEESTGFPLSANNISWSFTTKQTRSSTLHISSPGNDYTNSIDIDSANNMYVVGSTDDALSTTENLGNDDAYLAKYNNNHNQQWIVQFGTNEYDSATHIVIDAENNSYVLGYTDGSIDNLTTPTAADIFIVKFNSNGVQQWITQFGAIEGHEMSHGIKITNDKLYVTGSTNGIFAGQTSAGQHDFFIAEHDMASGSQNWLLQSGTSGEDHVIGLDIDTSGRLILAVDTTNFDKDKNVFEPESYIKIYAYNTTSGNPVIDWESELKSVDLSYQGRDLSVVNDGIYVSGERYPYFSPELPPSPDLFDKAGAFVAKFDSSLDGARQWDQTFDSRSFGSASTIAIDNNENIYLAGFTFGARSGIFNPDIGNETMLISVRQFTANAVEKWSAEINSSDHAMVKKMIFDNLGTLHIAGETHGSVDGNSLLGELDGFIAKINSSNGLVQ